ncbi:MAG: HlyD family efflux transporter periplasmic adaptor subunit, partial [Syntrophobacteraceae bacterium]|nr:HlyD family efflux transporter periplasmic adaptor subunit [Syntrophobacteraceae bacterium]
EGRYRVAIFDQFETATVEAQNALLKTLEEPPDYAVLIVLTADPELLLPTIVSRCQQVPLRPLTIAQVREALIEKWNVKANQANLKRLQDEYKTQLDISKARLEEADAQLKQLEVNLSYTRILSPIDGVVSDVTIQEGETIVTGLQVANLVTVLDPSLLDMWIYVDETNIGKANVGQRVEYTVDAFPNKTFAGTIQKIYPQPVTKDNIVYYLAIVEVAREDTAFLKPEMTSQVRIIFEEKGDILTAPNAAVKFDEGKQVAYKVLGPQKVERVELKTGIR